MTRFTSPTISVLAFVFIFLGSLPLVQSANCPDMNSFSCRKRGPCNTVACKTDAIHDEFAWKCVNPSDVNSCRATLYFALQCGNQPGSQICCVREGHTKVHPTEPNCNGPKVENAFLVELTTSVCDNADACWFAF